jgi:TonB-linked SusC/RagA family outer membrane protein
LANTGNAQRKNIEKVKISMNLQEKPLAQFFKEVESKTDFKFTYMDNIIDLKQAVTVEENNTSLYDVLVAVSMQTQLNFVQVNENIHVKPVTGTKRNPVEVAQQQEVTVSGKVIDDTGEPLPGATITVLGTMTGTITDIDGNYSITVPDGSVLVFSFIGYESMRALVDNRSQINITLKTDMSSLDEVVVVGYGVQDKRDITGAVSSVSADIIQEMPVGRIDKALIGRIPGLDIVSAGNNPGDGTQIRIRGNKSFSASNNPLIILDGMPFYGNIADINPYDVKSIDVLKDASSTSIYGSQGANGVIIITTQRGVTGKARFSLESFGGFSQRYGNVPYGNGDQYANRGREAFRAVGIYPQDGIDDALDEQIFFPEEYKSIQDGNSVNYQDQLLQAGYRQKHQLSVMGGAETVKYNISGSIYDEEGLLPGRKFDRYTIRSNLDINLSPKLTFGTSILLSYNEINRESSDDALSQAQRGSPLGIPYEEDGTPRYLPTPDGRLVLPVADYEFNSYKFDDKRWAAYISTYGSYQIMKNLSYRINLGGDININTIKESAGSLSILRREGTPIANINNSTQSRKIYESIFTYDKSFADNHKVTITGVHSIQSSREEISRVNVSDLPYELSGYDNVGSASVINQVASNLKETALVSYVGRLFYSYKNKYLLTTSIRADGASVFGPNNKWGYFPSLALAWRLTDESFMKNVSWLTDLKIRASYGITGNQAINPYQTQGGLTRSTYAWNESSAFGYNQSDLANKDLKWESTSSRNLGVDFSIINGRINGSFEWYSTNTFDLLMNRQLPITSGYNQVIQNIGKTANRGVEFNTSSVNIDNRNFRWSTDFTFFRNNEEIVQLFNGKVDDLGNQWFIGQPIHVYYDFNKIGIWQTSEKDEALQYFRKPGQIKIQDVNDDGKYTDDDRVILGNRVPKWIGSITNRFTYKNFDFSFMLYGRWGSTIQASQFNPHSQKRYNVLSFDYWTPDNPTNSYPQPDQNFENALNGSSLTYRDGSFIRLSQLSFGYSLPPAILEKISFNTMKIYFTGENLWYWTKSEAREFNIEPEINTNLNTLFPAQRTLIMGLSISF